MVIARKSGTRLQIKGGTPLQGSVRISGAKNAALPCMAACLLTAEDCFLENVPEIDDVEIMAAVIRSLGAEAEWAGPGTIRINAANIHTFVTPTELVTQNRASFLVMGPLLSRFGEAASSPPGGDILGQRPIDVHLVGFEALGATITRQDEKYLARATRLRGTRVFMDYPSHIGTENLVLAAILAQGKTVLRNAAAEPEVVCLAEMLQGMGARISGAGSNTIEIEGVSSLHGVRHRIIPDRIEAGTFAIAGAISCGEVTLEDVVPEHLDALIWKLRETGVEVAYDDATMTVRRRRPLRAISFQALPFPGFATDLQAAMAALLTQAEGVSVIHERVYDNRLLYVSELRRMGAEFIVAATTAIINGPAHLVGLPVTALDIRSGAALVLSGLVAQGTTEVKDIYHLDRGYSFLEQKLQGLGADVRRC